MRSLVVDLFCKMTQVVGNPREAASRTGWKAGQCRTATPFEEPCGLGQRDDLAPEMLFQPHPNQTRSMELTLGGLAMSDAREVVVLSGVRTAIGGYGGSLKDCAPSELAALCVRYAVGRAG